MTVALLSSCLDEENEGKENVPKEGTGFPGRGNRCRLGHLRDIGISAHTVSARLVALPRQLRESEAANEPRGRAQFPFLRSLVPLQVKQTNPRDLCDIAVRLDKSHANHRRYCL